MEVAIVKSAMGVAIVKSAMETMRARQISVDEGVTGPPREASQITPGSSPGLRADCRWPYYDGLFFDGFVFSRSVTKWTN